MAKAKQQYPTMFDLLSKMHVGKVTKGHGVRYVTSGKQPKSFPRRTGLITLTPEELLSVYAPLLRVQAGEIRGYQRTFDSSKAHGVAKYILGHSDYMEELAVVEISLTDGRGYATDGEHRIGGAIIANKPLRAVVTSRTWEQARRLFNNQRYASTPNRNVIILTDDGPYEEYLQDAVTNPDHPWNSIVSMAQSVGGGTNRISATSAYTMLKNYVGMQSGTSRKASSLAESRFDVARADELAELLKAFGTRQTNPFAFSGTGLRAIAGTARVVFRENVPAPQDKERWKKHMPSFPFANYLYLRSAVDLQEMMIRWWNKHLPEARKIKG